MSVGTNNGFLQSTVLNADGVCYADANGLVKNTTVGTSGQVLTSNGAGNAPTFQTTSGSGITTLDGDTGSATGATVTIKTGSATQNSGRTITFVASGTTVLLDVTDGNLNQLIGNGAGAALSGGPGGNIGYGPDALFALTTGGTNIAIGSSTLNGILTGSNNIALGNGAGAGYVAGSESSNIVIGNSGTVSDSNTMRIGAQGSGTGQQNKCFIAGINGVTTANTQVVTINSSTGQLGAATIPAISGLVLLQTLTASTSAAVNFTIGISSTFRNYVLVWDNCGGSAASQMLQIQLSSNGGSSYITTGYTSGYNQNAYNSATTSNQNITSGLVLGDCSNTNTTSGTCYLYNLTNTQFPMSQGASAEVGGTPSAFLNTLVGSYNTKTAMNALRVLATSGNLVTGDFSLYGISQ